MHPKDSHGPNLYIFNQIFTFACSIFPVDARRRDNCWGLARALCTLDESEWDWGEAKARLSLSGNCDRIYGSLCLRRGAAVCVCVCVCVCVKNCSSQNDHLRLFLKWEILPQPNIKIAHCCSRNKHVYSLLPVSANFPVHEKCMVVTFL